MAQEDIGMGAGAKFQVNDQDFVWTGGDVTVNYKEHDTNDSSDAVNEQFRGGRRRMMAEGNFQQETNRNIHAGPYFLGKDEFVDVKFYPDGEDTVPYHAPKWLRSSIKIQMPVKQGEPCTGSISGGSSGEFFTPGDS